ncbi:MAG TPA: hypothetical protein VM120_08390 [Bryobacteraceae bacterium]|nr:hypothetical protein [Bryobacteraceae bacterium]
MRNLLVLLAGWSVAAHGAEIIDRIAVVAGKHVIKSSDILRDLRVTSFLNREPLDISPEARRKAAERLIDQTIIRNQIVSGGYRMPGTEEADGLLKQLRQDRAAGSTEAFRESLGAYNLTEFELRDRLLWQLTVLRFIDQRFRPGVLVSDQEVRSYYDQHAAEPQSPFPALEPKIRALLEAERINKNFEQWLDDSRKRIRIDYKQEALQ